VPTKQRLSNAYDNKKLHEQDICVYSFLFPAFLALINRHSVARRTVGTTSMLKKEDEKWITNDNEDLSPQGFIGSSGFTGQVYKVTIRHPSLIPDKRSK
jgi:hypothetical protein